MSQTLTFAAGSVFGLAVGEDWGRVVAVKDVIGVGIYLAVGIVALAALQAIVRRRDRRGGGE